MRTRVSAGEPPDESFAAAEEPKIDAPIAPGLDSPEGFNLAPIMTTKSQVLTRQVGEEAKKDPAALARVLRSWLNESVQT